MHLREATLSADRAFPHTYSIRLCQEKKKRRAQTSHLSVQNSTNITQTPKAGSTCGLGLQLLWREQTTSPSLFPGLCLALLCKPVLAKVCPLSLQSLSCGFCGGQRYLNLNVKAGCIFQEYREELSPTSSFSLQVLSKLFPRPFGGKVFQLLKGKKLQLIFSICNDYY